MSTSVIVNGRVLTPERTLEEAAVVIEGERILAVQPGSSYPAGASVIDAHSSIVAPGFIDIHVHGSAGHDVMDATPQALHEMASFLTRYGVTSFLPTTMTASPEHLRAAVANIARTMREQRGAWGARILGVHLEGPYLSRSYPGAQPTEQMRVADPSEYEQLFASGIVRLLTLAPEVPGNMEMLQYAAAHGAAVAVGHSGASYDEVLAAVELGLSQATHTFNGMAPLHQREPGVVGAVLTCDRIYTQVIVDLIHVHPAVVRLLVRAKGIERVLLITDAMRATGLQEGVYELGDSQSVTVSQGAVRLTHGNSLAGSILTMDQAVRNVSAAADLPLHHALTMASSIPARALHLDHELGTIKPGYLADLTLLDQAGYVQLTMVRGTIAYTR